MRKEIWKDVPGFEGLYAVSDLGHVKSLERVTRGGAMLVPERILKPAKATRGGYDVVQLHNHGRRTLRTVHSLMAAAFIGARPPGLDICHRNDDRINDLDNLRDDIRAGNIADAMRNGRTPKGVAHWNAKMTLEKADEIRAAYAGKRGTMAELGDDFGVTASTIHRVVRGAWK